MSEQNSRLTCFSVSEPNNAMLLSFQSYFLAFTRPGEILQCEKFIYHTDETFSSMIINIVACVYNIHKYVFYKLMFNVAFIVETITSINIYKIG